MYFINHRFDGCQDLFLCFDVINIISTSCTLYIELYKNLRYVHICINLYGYSCIVQQKVNYFLRNKKFCIVLYFKYCKLQRNLYRLIFEFSAGTESRVSLCHQYWARPACTSVQSDQALYCWLTKFSSWYSYIIMIILKEFWELVSQWSKNKYV